MVTGTEWVGDTKGTGEYAEVNGINLYFETHGAGRPMILLHGASVRARCSGRSFPRSPSTTRSSPSTSRATAGPLTSTDRSTSG